jgi:hypothetical protein
MSHDPLPNDHLDPLLRAWHAANAARAGELRATTLARAAAEGAPNRGRTARGFWIGRGLAAAAVLALAVVAAFILPLFPGDALAAGGVVQVPDGGRLVALDRAGQVLGACPLARTDVHVDIAGPFTRVTLAQRFQNPYRVPIEAVYTFPLGERSAVDRMRMVVRGPGGERVVDGVVKERDLARMVYEAAREQGYVASLLEQERPNIFTQSVANIEPGSTVTVEISYVETLAMKDGTYEFAFPMVVGPRYVPGQPSQARPVPAGWTARTGVVLLGPAGIEVAPATDAEAAPGATAAPAATPMPPAPPSGPRLLAQLEDAIPVETPGADVRAALGEPVVRFTATYADGSQEPGALHASGAGDVGGRWFVLPSSAAPAGQGFAPGTAEVPDASRITPMPVRPETRAGHDVSLSVTLDTGGPGVRQLVSQQHGVDVAWTGPSRCTIALRGGSTIPNRDFVLQWGLDGGGVLEGAFSHARQTAAEADRAAPAPPHDGFFTLVMTPPPPSANPEAIARELVFVLDTSGSMSGFPIEKSKEVMRRMLASMRPADTFNVVTFAGATAVLWPELRPATADNVRVALDFVNGRQAGGGTEMMKAIEAALVQMPRGPVEVPPDGRASVPPRTPVSPTGGTRAAESAPAGSDAGPQSRAGAAPMRIAVFLTDGYVGNDQGIIAAVARNADTTRVFTFGIGTSVNRYLLEEMARQGRGACDIVLLSDAADAAVDLFTRRIQTPVLRDITVEFRGVEVTDLHPRGRLLPDLFDTQPLVVHGRWTAGGAGTVVVRGRTAAGPFERSIPVRLEPGGTATMLPQLWARAAVDAVLAPRLAEVERQTLPADIRAQVVRLGEAFQIMTPYTSFVAVERSRVIVGGRPMLVTVPVEFPEGLRWEGFFGDSWCNDAVRAAAREAEGLLPEASAAIGTRGAAGEAVVLDLGEAEAWQAKGVALEAAEKGESLAFTEHSALSSGARQDRVSSRADAARDSGTWRERRNERVGVVVEARPGHAALADRSGGYGGVAGGGGGLGGGNAGTTALGADPARTAVASSSPVSGGADRPAGAPRLQPVASTPPMETATPAPGTPPAGRAAPAKAPPAPPAPPPPPASAAPPAPAGPEAPVAAKGAVPGGPVPSAEAAPSPAPARDAAALDATAVADALPPRMAIPLGARDTLLRVLERRLLALVLYDRLALPRRMELPALPEDIARLCAPPATAARDFRDATVELVVLVDGAVTPALRAALADARFTIKGDAPVPGPGGRRTLVGSAPVDALVALALRPEVRRIEPLEAVPEGGAAAPRGP